MESVKYDISFAPNYKTLVSAGHSHFSRVADALAEFIDNSIQACQGRVEQRKIEVGLDIDDNMEKDSYLSILDNGEGMDRKTLAEFAVYSLDKESRMLNPSKDNSSNISKFGVGAKQAGFYLGTRIHVLTTTSGSSKILELILDKNEIEERFFNDEDVYKGHISSHDVLPLTTSKSTDNNIGDIEMDGQINGRLQNLVNELIRRNIQINDGQDQYESTFTLITVRLRDEIKRKLHREESYKNLPTQLADIYHFHLHPENLPNAVASRIFEQYSSDDGLVMTEPICQRALRGMNALNAQSALDISVQFFQRDRATFAAIPLQKLCDVNCLYFKRARHCFRFNLELPDPNSATGSGQGERKNVQGIILYFPSVNGQETMPIAGSPKTLEAARFGFEELRGSNELSIADNEEDFDQVDTLMSDVDQPEDAVFRIYWQNRLVPDAFLSKLSFFPDAKSPAQCIRHGIPLAWGKRVKSFLFFDANFHNISNNKLKINVDPDLQSWITSKPVTQNTISYPKNVMKGLFPKWLKSCHEKFDQEYVYSVLRTGNIEKAKLIYNKSTKTKLRENAAPLHVFSRLQFSAANDVTALTTGDNIRINLSGHEVRRQAGISSGNKKKVVFGKILGFIKFCHMPSSMTEAYGQGLVWYKQVPEIVFGEEHMVNISCLDLMSADKFVKEKELEEVAKRAPNKVKVEIYHRPHAARNTALMSTSRHHHYEDGSQTLQNKNKEYFGKENVEDVSDVGEIILFAGEAVDITVTVLSAAEKLVLHRPDDQSRKYAVRMHTEDMDFKKSDPKMLYAKKVDEGTQSVSFDRYRYDAKDFETNAVVHYFNKIRFGKVNGSEVCLNVDVVDGERVVLSKSFHVTISAGNVSQFSIQDSEFYDEKKPCVRMLGSFIPQFTLCLLDGAGNKSSSFYPPTGQRDGKDKKSTGYWVRIKSRDEDISVEAYNDDILSKEYRVPEDCLGSEIEIGPEIFLPFPVEDDDADESSLRHDQLLDLLGRAPSLTEAELHEEWKSYGLKRPFISCVKAGRKVVLFDVTTNLCPGVSETFCITFTPGFPSRICLLDYVSKKSEPHLSVRNGEHLPSITIACFDNFNNRTDPEEGAEWTIRLVDDGPVKSIGNEAGVFPVLKEGKAVLKNLVMNVDQLTPSAGGGMRLEQKFELIWPSEDLIDQKLAPQCKIETLVFPGNRPERIEILLHGRPITALTLSEKVGTVLTGLSVCVIDEAGDIWENTAGWPVEVYGSWEAFQSTYQAMTRNEAAERQQGYLSSVDALVDINLPTNINETPNVLEFTVTCSIDTPTGEQSLEGDFNVELTPDVPVRWKILLNETNHRGIERQIRKRNGEDDGTVVHVRCGDEEDLISKIAGACAVDTHGNMAYFSDGVGDLRPTLIVKWDDDPISELDLECIIRMPPNSENPPDCVSSAWTSKECRFRGPFAMLLESNNSVLPGTFALKPTSSTNLQRDYSGLLPNAIFSNNLSNTARPFWMYCVDGKKLLSPSNALQGIVFPGLPVALRLFSETLMKLPGYSAADTLDANSQQLLDNVTSRFSLNTSVGVKAFSRVPFTCESTLSDLQVVVVDSCDNIINVKQLSICLNELTIKLSFNPSVPNLDHTLPANGFVDDAFIEYVSKTNVRSGCVPFNINFDDMLSNMKEYQLKEGMLLNLMFTASYTTCPISDYSSTTQANSRKRKSCGISSTDVVDACKDVATGNERRKIHLEPARLNCTLKMLDVVTSLDISIRAQRSTGEWELETELNSGTPFYLQLVLTSKHSKFRCDPRLEDVDLVVKHADLVGGRCFACDVVDDLDAYLMCGRISCDLENSDSRQRVIEYPVIEDLTKCGQYTFDFCYTDSREHLSSEVLDGMLSCKPPTISQSFNVVVQAGPGVVLLPSPYSEPLLFGRSKSRKITKKICSRYGKIDDAMASFSSDVFVTDSDMTDSQERWLIPCGQTLDVCLYDKFGNCAKFPPDSDYICVAKVKLRKSCNADSATTDESKYPPFRIPSLEGSNDLGYLAGTIISESVCQFKSLALEKIVASHNDGSSKTALNLKLVLVFSVLPKEVVYGKFCRREKLEIRNYRVKFYYTKEVAQMHSHHELSQLLEPQLALIEECKTVIAAKNVQHDETLAAMAQLLSRCSDKTLKSFHSVPDSFKKSSFMHCEKYLTDQLIAIGDNFEDFEVRRPVKDISHLVHLSSENGYVGLVVDLARVKDEKLAHILSWAAGADTPSSKAEGGDYGGYMAAYVFVTDRDAKKALGRQGLRRASYFLLDRMISARIRQGGRTESNYLPPFPSDVAGNPKHMLNLIELEDDDLNLRSTVFYSIFKGKMLIDTNGDAERYIAQLHSRGVLDIPTIYTMEGCRYRSDGLFTPKDCIPAELNFVFGEPQNTERFRLTLLQKDLETLNDIKLSMNRRDGIIQELRQLEQRCNVAQQEIDSLRSTFNIPVRASQSPTKKRESAEEKAVLNSTSKKRIRNDKI